MLSSTVVNDYREFHQLIFELMSQDETCGGTTLCFKTACVRAEHLNSLHGQSCCCNAAHPNHLPTRLSRSLSQEPGSQQVGGNTGVLLHRQYLHLPHGGKEVELRSKNGQLRKGGKEGK